MTPYEINLLLHIYAVAEDHPHEREQRKLYLETIGAFIGEKLVEECPVVAPPGYPQRKYSVTERGRAYVEYGLMRVPLPTREWRIPEQTQWASASTDILEGGK